MYQSNALPESYVLDHIREIRCLTRVLVGEPLKASPTLPDGMKEYKCTYVHL